MENTLYNQVFSFFASFLFGVIFSVLFDLLKIIETIFNKIDQNSIDIVYFIIISFCSFLLSLPINSGEVSFYILFAELLGWIAWHFVVSKKFLCKACATILKIKKIALTLLKTKIIYSSINFKNTVKEFIKKSVDNKKQN